MSTPSADFFRPNPARSICLNGPVDQELVYRVSPQILRLQHESRDPITVYIDSPGGDIAHAAAILRLLSAPSLDSPRPCPLITVATTLAASSAAVLLTSGDYVIAYPDSRIHFHGVRMYREAPITVEEAADVARNLKARNEAFAVSLSRTRGQQFFFRFVSLRSEFDAYRTRDAKAMTEKDCFVGMISEKLSSWGMEVIRKAEVRNKRYESLSSRIFKSRGINRQLRRLQNDPRPGQYKKLEAEILKAIVAFELSSNRRVRGWRFSGEGMAQVADDFFILNEYIGQHKNEWIEDFCEGFKDFVLEDDVKAEIEALPQEQRKAARVLKLTPVLLPVWLFFGAICHVLQVEENPLTPTDAFWLGLVDEIPGVDLPTLRKVAERKPTAQQPGAAATA